MLLVGQFLTDGVLKGMDGFTRGTGYLVADYFYPLTLQSITMNIVLVVRTIQLSTLGISSSLASKSKLFVGRVPPKLYLQLIQAGAEGSLGVCEGRVGSNFRA